MWHQRHAACMGQVGVWYIPVLQQGSVQTGPAMGGRDGRKSNSSRVVCKQNWGLKQWARPRAAAAALRHEHMRNGGATDLTAGRGSACTATK